MFIESRVRSGKRNGQTHGDRWIVLGTSTKDGRRWNPSKEQREALGLTSFNRTRRLEKHCREPLSLPGMPENAPAGSEAEYFELTHRKVRRPSHPPADGKVTFAAAWRKTRVVGCQGLSHTFVKADDVPRQLRDSVQWLGRMML